MNPKLRSYIDKHFEHTSGVWLQESFILSSNETFRRTDLQQLFRDCSLSHNLYYSDTDIDPFFPFEIYDDNDLIALGYMEEDEQHLLYLQHNKQVLINEL